MRFTVPAAACLEEAGAELVDACLERGEVEVEFGGEVLGGSGAAEDAAAGQFLVVRVDEVAARLHVEDGAEEGAVFGAEYGLDLGGGAELEDLRARTWALAAF